MQSERQFIPLEANRGSRICEIKERAKERSPFIWGKNQAGVSLSAHERAPPRLTCSDIHDKGEVLACMLMKLTSLDCRIHMLMNFLYHTGPQTVRFSGHAYLDTFTAAATYTRCRHSHNKGVSWFAAGVWTSAALWLSLPLWRRLQASSGGFRCWHARRPSSAAPQPRPCHAYSELEARPETAVGPNVWQT